MAGKGDKNNRTPNHKARAEFAVFDKTVFQWCEIENIQFECNTNLKLCSELISQEDILDKFQFRMLKKDNAWITK